MKSISVVLTFLIGTFILFAFTSIKDERVSLTIKVNDLKNSTGQVIISLYNKDGSIPDEELKNYYQSLKVAIKNKSAEATFKNLPKGKYAVNIVHDENKNGKIDKGWILPIEGIGFSNFTTIGFSNKPNFKKASFELQMNREIAIKTIYM